MNHVDFYRPNAPAASALDAEHVCCLYRGAVISGRGLRNSHIACALWIRGEHDRMSPAGLLQYGDRTPDGAVNGSLLHGAGRTRLTTRGRATVVHAESRLLGRFCTSWLLQHLGFGFGQLYDAHGTRVCALRCPWWGPSSPQWRDCCGALCRGKETLAFVINRKDASERDAWTRHDLAEPQSPRRRWPPFITDPWDLFVHEPPATSSPLFVCRASTPPLFLLRNPELAATICAWSRVFYAG